MNEIMESAPMILIALLVSSTVTSLCVEAIKKMFNVASPNILAAIVSVVIGVGIGIGIVVLKQLPVSAETVIFVIALTVLTWLCAMLGYDKVVQTISQLKGK